MREMCECCDSKLSDFECPVCGRWVCKKCYNKSAEACDICLEEGDEEGDDGYTASLVRKIDKGLGVKVLGRM